MADLFEKDFPRAVLHMDADAFFASVEVAKNPSLRGKPVVVGQERGIASAFSYEAKALGIIRGMPIFQIKRKFPQMIILPGDYKSYSLYSTKMFNIVRRYCDDVEEYSIDECFADITGWDKPLKMTYEEILRRIQSEISDELQISVSLGLASTKVLAKIASKQNKPAGLTLLPAKEVQGFLLRTPIEKVWGIGPRTSQFLRKNDISTALDFTKKDEGWIRHFLSKPFLDIWHELNCSERYKIDPRVKDSQNSISKTRTFSPPSNDTSFLLSQLSKNLEGACKRARYFRLIARKISFFLKTKEFSFHKREIKILVPTNLPEIIFPTIQDEFHKIRKKAFKYRATGVILHDLIGNHVVQTDLFGETMRAARFEEIHKQIDELEERFGKRVIHLASTQKALKHQTSGATDADDSSHNLLFL